jgi:isoleucyl-tRNA synthetase
VAAEKKEAAYQTVYECLEATAKLMSPIAPFFGEWLYRTLTEGTGGEADSVHLASFPEVNEEERDEALERRMDLARTIASTALSLRNQAEINVRWPLPRLLVVTGTGVLGTEVEKVRDVILDEVNVKDIQYVKHTSDVVHRSAKPDFSRLGPRLGDLVKAVNQKVRRLDDETIDEYVETGELTLSVDGEEVALGPDDLVVQSEGIEGWLVEQEGDVTVALDTEITPELRAEGLAREVVKRIQNLRKAAGFEVTDRIEVTYHGSLQIADALAEHADWVRNETLALELQPFDRARPLPREAVETFDIDEEQITIGVRRVRADAPLDS